MEENWFLFQNEKIITLNKNIKLNPNTISSMKKYFTRHYVFLKTNTNCFHCAELDSNFILPAEFETISMKPALSLLDANDYNALTRAYSIIRWDKNHQHCGQCGRLTDCIPECFERICETCSLIFYPRISPCIIVLIQKEDEILMARSHHFLPGVYGVIAGFVEVGENLEQAVHREVAEEVGIKIKNLTYFGSQPWPFPDSLMVAFTADYESGELTPNPSEIEAAGWYRFDNLPGLPGSNISIARTLIDAFIAGKKVKDESHS